MTTGWTPSVDEEQKMMKVLKQLDVLESWVVNILSINVHYHIFLIYIIDKLYNIVFT